MRLLVVTAQLKIPVEEFRIGYSRSSGPGGQNVNKVSSKVTVRWAVGTSPSLSDDLRQKVVVHLGPRLTASGDLLVTSQRFRDASKNRTDCLEKLRKLIADAVRPRKVRRRTNPTRGSVARRLDEKRLRAHKKDSRRPEPWS
jgi:ribosome-associated protein